MNDELPESLRRVVPPAAPAALRPRVLDAVNAELHARRRPRWERMFELASAACLVVGLCATAWQWRADRQWQNRRDVGPLAQRDVDGLAPQAGPAGWMVYAPELADAAELFDTVPRQPHSLMGKRRS